MKKFVVLLKKEKQQRMNGKMMSLTFFELYAVYIKKNMTILFPYLLVNMFKQRYITYVKSYKYLNKSISIKTNISTF